MTARCAQYMGALKNFESPRVCLRLLLPKFFLRLLRSILCVYKIWSSYSFARSWDNSDWIFGLGCEPQSWGRGGPRGSGWYRSKERWLVLYRPCWLERWHPDSIIQGEGLENGVWQLQAHHSAVCTGKGLCTCPLSPHSAPPRHYTTPRTIRICSRSV